MGQNYLIDTNVVIDYTSNLLPAKGEVFVENIFNTGFNISVVVQIEALGYDGDPAKMLLLEKFLALANVFPVGAAVAQQAIKLRRIKKIKLGDAIIAATALVHGLVVVSRNTSDFNNIPGLQVIDPWQM
jgi:predicted nucleic acid-binding protein